jgi:hypothetical protein
MVVPHRFEKDITVRSAKIKNTVIIPWKKIAAYINIV